MCSLLSVRFQDEAFRKELYAQIGLVQYNSDAFFCGIFGAEGLK